MLQTSTIPEFGSVVTISGARCPSCGGDIGRIFYTVQAVPAHQVRLLHSREQALECAKGDLNLRFCEGCGFIWNETFDPDLVAYHEDYESTQAVSPAFNRFHAELARDLVGRYDLIGKEVFEIGCGQGEFLSLICDMGVRRARGFDPVLRDVSSPHPSVEIVKGWYGEAYADLRPDLVCSKMVMEHIPDPGRFLRMLRRTIGDRPEAVAFAMMPEARRILQLCAFWDIYYEHCAYFSLGSLARAFRGAGFDPIDVRPGFGDQYALIGARPGTGRTAPLEAEDDIAQLSREVDAFAEQVSAARAGWLGWLREHHAAGRRVALWNGGSKAVAFLTTLGVRDEVGLAVDINPRRNGKYIAGTGQRISTPDGLSEFRPDIVLIMSPIYRDEIAASLRELGLEPQLVSIEEEPWSIEEEPRKSRIA